jgi:hypothetical protein
MKKVFLYKKWNFLVFLNNLVYSGFFAYKKKYYFYVLILINSMFNKFIILVLFFS